MKVGLDDDASSSIQNLRPHKRGTGILKIGKELGIGAVQRVVMEQPRPFDVGVAEAAFAYQ